MRVFKGYVINTGIGLHVIASKAKQSRASLTRLLQGLTMTLSLLTISPNYSYAYSSGDTIIVKRKQNRKVPLVKKKFVFIDEEQSYSPDAYSNAGTIPSYETNQTINHNRQGLNNLSSNLVKKPSTQNQVKKLTNEKLSLTKSSQINKIDKSAGHAKDQNEKYNDNRQDEWESFAVEEPDARQQVQQQYWEESLEVRAKLKGR